jgi:hypothetical protein
MKSIIICLILSFFLYNCGEKKEVNSVTSSTQTKENSGAIDEVKEPEWVSGLKITFQNLSAEKCIEVPREDWMDEDPEPFCASRKIKLATISLNDEKVASLINSKIVKSITSGFGENSGNSSVRTYMNSIKSITSVEDGAMQEEQRCELLHNSNKLLSLDLFYESFMYGAAHGIAGVTSLNFDLQTGSKVGLKDVFVQGYERKIFPIVKRNLFKDYGSEGWEDFKLTDNVSIGKNGVSFNYKQYEIGSYAMGAPSVLVKWSEIKELLKENPYVDFKQFLN